jgi:hypothetical protein
MYMFVPGACVPVRLPGLSDFFITTKKSPSRMARGFFVVCPLKKEGRPPGRPSSYIDFSSGTSS